MSVELSHGFRIIGQKILYDDVNGFGTDIKTGSTVMVDLSVKGFDHDRPDARPILAALRAEMGASPQRVRSKKRASA